MTFHPHPCLSPVCPLQLFPDLRCSSAPSKHQSFKGNGDAAPGSSPRQQNTLNLNRCCNSEHGTGIKALSGLCSTSVQHGSKWLRLHSGTTHQKAAASLPFHFSWEHIIFPEKAAPGSLTSAWLMGRPIRFLPKRRRN